MHSRTAHIYLFIYLNYKPLKFAFNIRKGLNSILQKRNITIDALISLLGND